VHCLWLTNESRPSDGRYRQRFAISYRSNWSRFRILSKITRVKQNAYGVYDTEAPAWRTGPIRIDRYTVTMCPLLRQNVLKVCTGEYKEILPHLLTVASSVQHVSDKTRRSRSLILLKRFPFPDAGDPGHIGAEAGEQGPLRLVLGGNGTAQHL
jgi:hypothetical protein